MSISTATSRASKVVAVALAVVVLATAASVAGALVPDASVDPRQTRFEAAGEQGVDAFTPDLRLLEETGREPSAPRTNQEVDGRANGTTIAAQEACDATALFENLEADTEKRDVWRSVFGLTDTDVGRFIDGLSPAILVQDSVVMNHGYRDGVAQPVRTILQAGTLVLVDGFGVPRVLCKCGNPLLTSAPVGMEMAEGDPWPNFDSKRVVSLIPIEPPTAVPSTPTVTPTGVPAPTATPTVTPDPTATPITPTVTPDPTVTPVPTSTPEPVNVPPPPPTVTPVPTPTPTVTPEPFQIECTIDPPVLAAGTEFTITVSWTPADVLLIVLINDVQRQGGVASPWVASDRLPTGAVGAPIDYFVTGPDNLQRSGSCPYTPGVITEEPPPVRCDPTSTPYNAAPYALVSGKCIVELTGPGASCPSIVVSGVTLTGTLLSPPGNVCEL